MPNSNYWVEFEGRTTQATHIDGRRLLVLQTDIVAGGAAPQEYTFQEAGDFDAPSLTVFVGDPDRPLKVTPVEIYRRDQG